MKNLRFYLLLAAIMGMVFLMNCEKEEPAPDKPPTVANPVEDVTVLKNAPNSEIDLTDVFTDENNDDELITKAVEDNTNETLVVASISGNTLTLEYQADQTGTATITIKATSNGLTVEDVFEVVVNAPPDEAPSVANPIEDVSVMMNAENTEIDLADVFTDADDDDTHIVKVVQENTNEELVVASISENTLTLDYQADQSGTATITIRATSNEQIVDDVFEVNVSEPDDEAPTAANPIEDVSVMMNAENTDIDLTNVFTDADNDDTQITKAVQENSNETLVVASISDNTLTLDYQTDQFGTATITIRATSNGQTVDDVFEVTVSEPDDQPPFVANPIADVTAAIYEDGEINLTDVFSDPDNDDSQITKAVYDNTNETVVVATISDNTLTLAYQEGQSGTATITIRATSNGKTVDDVFEVTLVPNQYPFVANPIEDVFVEENADDTTIDLTDVFSDPDDDDNLITKAVLSNTNESLLVASISDNTLTLDYQTDQTGTATITIRATSNGQTVDDVFEVTVSESSIEGGTWELYGELMPIHGIENLRVTFDDNLNATDVSFSLDGASESYSGGDVSGAANVNGLEVEFEIDFGRHTASFDGTLDNDRNSGTGLVYYRIMKKVGPTFVPQVGTDDDGTITRQ